ncbi:hypothetical protein BDK92_7073 [Micromonospora pisi]|uniref:Uncharacterized protein n=1 Tax=Micromonospora pisi TaxID=589240 RepID=A0A495JUX7_9ACTN|nr:hypothetical protein [Micromonospora pisi]RKR92631.1 hypothetical protein BDK92_7073 [Micromonospora pisi]
MITRDDLTITRSTAEWGGPIAVVTVDFPERWTNELKTRTFELRSTEGLDTISSDGGIFVHELHPGRHRDRDWRGVFKTLDMEEALVRLVKYLNQLLDRQNAEVSASSSLAELREALSGFENALEDNSRRDFEEEWAQAVAAMTAVDIALRSRGDGHPPRAANTRPRVVTLCGSIRFADQFRRVERELALTGVVVLSPAFPLPGEPAPTSEQIANLKARHFAAIGMSDEVIVVCPGKYMGDSTRAEIDHATQAGKPVTYRYEETGAVAGTGAAAITGSSTPTF